MVVGTVPKYGMLFGLLICLMLSMVGCQIDWTFVDNAEAAPAARSLVSLPLPTVGAQVTPGPIVALVIPPTPTPTPTLAPDGGSNEELVQRGEAVYTENCATCHQSNGQGQDDYPALAGNAFVTAQDPTAIIQTVRNGRGAMPAFGDTLSNQEIAAVISYIRNSWGNSAEPVAVEQVRSVANSGNSGSQ